MKRAWMISLAGHTALLMLLFGWTFFGKTPSRLSGYPQTIKASLVTGGEVPPERAAVSSARQQRMPTPPKQTPPPARPAPPLPGRSAKPNPEPPGEPRGSAITTDGQNFPFPQYLAILQARVEREWRPPHLREEGISCVVHFVIDRFGKLKSLVVEKSSGNPLFDQSGLRAVQVAAPFPPLPPGYAQPTLSVHFEFAERKS